MLSEKRSEIFDFRRKCCWILESMQRPAPQANFVVEKCLFICWKWRTFDLKNVKFGAFCWKMEENGQFWWKTLVKKQLNTQKFLEKYLYLSSKCSENYNFCRKYGKFWTFLVKKGNFGHFWWKTIMVSHHNGQYDFWKIFQKIFPGMGVEPPRVPSPL